MFFHVSLIVSIPGTGELKSKPTQHSAKELLSLGIQPDVIGDSLAVHPADVYLHPVLNAPVGEGLGYGEVGVVEGHITDEIKSRV